LRLRLTRFALKSALPPTLLCVLAGARALRELNALPRTRCALDASLRWARRLADARRLRSRPGIGASAQ